MPYSDYTAADLMADESFQNWFYKRNQEHIQFWEQWISQHPHKSKIVEEAIYLLTQLQFTELPVGQAKIESSWQQLEKLLEPATKHNRHTVNRKLSPVWYKVAAAITGILLVASIYFLAERSNTVTHHTQYAELSTITLPDGSTVTLNGNSTLRYKSQWHSDSPREVWLDGEAFFQVKKKPDVGTTLAAKFIVHASQMDVQVLGTSFNVSDRRGKTKVVLNTGKVQLASHHTESEIPTMMQPGELALFSEKDQKIVKQIVNPENFSSWVNKKLVFDNTTIREIALLLEETYGLQVEVKDSLLLNQKVSGSVPNENINILLSALSRSFDLHIGRSGKKITLRSE
jgi:ferric-dicitrate binding protein FerR (iron transport regulator)